MNLFSYFKDPKVVDDEWVFLFYLKDPKVVYDECVFLFQWS